jgi:multiple sugar transport system substrate-binding protein
VRQHTPRPIRTKKEENPTINKLFFLYSCEFLGDKKMHKKNHSLTLTLVAVLLVTLVLSSVPVLAQEEAEITISFPGDRRQPVVEELIADFVAAKAEAGVDVKVNINAPTTEYENQLLIDFTAGAGPDVYMVSAERIPELVESDYIMPLDDLLAAWADWDQFFPGMKDVVTYKDHKYAVMTDFDGRLLYYRKDVFEQAGIELPFNPTSWADIFAAADQIKANVPDVWPFEVEAGTAWGEGTTIDGWFMVFGGVGGTLYDPEDGKWVVESPEMLASLQFYEDVFVNYEYAPVEPFLEAEPWVPILQEMFPNGQLAMIVGLSAMWELYAPDSEWAPIENRDEVVGWAPMPAKEPGAARGNDFISMGGGWGWAISPESDATDLAWELVQFLTSADSVARYNASTGGLVTRADAVTGEYAENEFLVGVSEQVVPFSRVRPADPDYGRVSAEIQIATERILLGEATAQEAMTMFAEAVEQIVGADNVKRIEG